MDILEGNPKEVIACTRLDKEGVPYVFVANQGKNKVTAKSEGEAFQGIRYDLESGNMSPIRGDGKEIEIRLGAFESQLIRVEASKCHQEAFTEVKTFIEQMADTSLLGEQQRIRNIFDKTKRVI